MGRTAPVTPEPSALAVEVRDFRKRYDEHEAVCGVDLAIGSGEVFGLLGPDGAGKSTLLKAIAGVLSFDAGSVEVLGTRIDSESAAERIKGRIGFMPQGLGLNLYPDLTVEENVDFFARLRGVPPATLLARKRRLLGVTRLEPFRARRMRALSGGMKQKLGLVCTLVHAPDLLILDEPTTGIDPVSRRDFWAVLSELMRERVMTALVSTAYLDEATRFDRVSLLFDGRELASGSPTALEARIPGSIVRVNIDPESQLAALARLKERFEQVEALGPFVRVFVAGAEAAAASEQVRALLAGLPVHEVEPSDPDLDDVFVALLRREEPARAVGTADEDRAPSRASPAGEEHRTAIEAVELTRDFGDFRAVDRVSFRVRQGEIFGLLGANGAGKTTVIKMLTGILRPSAGAGEVAGVDMRRASTAIKQRIGYMSQAFSLYTELTVAENIALYGGIYGLDGAELRAQSAWICEMAGLTERLRSPAGSLPMGLRQRLALGCALVHRPEVLFLDEPTSGVDPRGRRHFWEILYGLARRDGVAILVTTHHMSEAEHCDRLALMFAGRIVADAPPSMLKAEVEGEAGHAFELSVSQPEAALGLLRGAGRTSAALFGRRLHVLLSDPETALPDIRAALELAGIQVHAVEKRPLSIEDVFVYRVTQLERQQAADNAGDPS